MGWQTQSLLVPGHLPLAIPGNEKGPTTDRQLSPLWVRVVKGSYLVMQILIKRTNLVYESSAIPIQLCLPGTIQQNPVSQRLIIHIPSAHHSSTSGSTSFPATYISVYGFLSLPCFSKLLSLQCFPFHLPCFFSPFLCSCLYTCSENLMEPISPSLALSPWSFWLLPSAYTSESVSTRPMPVPPLWPLLQSFLSPPAGLFSAVSPSDPSPPHPLSVPVLAPPTRLFSSEPLPTPEGPHPLLPPRQLPSSLWGSPVCSAFLPRLPPQAPFPPYLFTPAWRPRPSHIPFVAVS